MPPTPGPEMTPVHSPSPRRTPDPARLLLILDSLADGVLFVDSDRTVTYANPRAGVLLGSSAADLVGRSVLSVLLAPGMLDLARVERFLASEEEALWAEEGRFRREGATTFPVSYTLERVGGGKAGVPSGVVVVFRDLTEEQNAAANLRRAQVEAEAAQQAAVQKAEFLANMSHEIRTPMTAILGYADLMGQPGTSAEELREYHQIIHRNGEHLLAIINDILDLSKIEAGKLVVERIPCSVAEIATDVHSLARQRAEEKGLGFELEFSGTVPESIGSDPTRLRQVLVNLVGNAIKFTSEGSVKISVIGDPLQESLCFVVADTGIGITEEQQARIFEAFAQADTSTTRRFGGSGLGLAISVRLAQMLGGVIELESRIARGSTFRLTLDLSDQDDVDWEVGDSLCRIPPPPSEIRFLPEELALAGRRILYAEDGPDNQRLVRHILDRAGASVTIVENGEQAYEFALHAETADEPFDCILMDMQMPVLDGYAATQRLRDVGFGRAIVALTAHAMKGDGERCIEAGCDLYLTKPIDRRHLVASLATLLAEHELAQ